MRQKNPPAKVSDACVLKKPPKRGGREKIPKKNRMPFALVGCAQKKKPRAKVNDACVLKRHPKREGREKIPKKNRRAHNCSSQEAKNRWERVGARWQERFLLGPADPRIFRNPHGALDRSSAGLSGNFASYGVNTISGLQAVNFNHFGCASCRPFLQDV